MQCQGFRSDGSKPQTRHLQPPSGIWVEGLGFGIWVEGLGFRAQHGGKFIIIQNRYRCTFGSSISMLSSSTTRLPNVLKDDICTHSHTPKQFMKRSSKFEEASIGRHSSNESSSLFAAGRIPACLRVI